jgi:hypothetical protein
MEIHIFILSNVIFFGPQVWATFDKIGTPLLTTSLNKTTFCIMHYVTLKILSGIEIVSCSKLNYFQLYILGSVVLPQGTMNRPRCNQKGHDKKSKSGEKSFKHSFIYARNLETSIEFNLDI